MSCPRSKTTSRWVRAGSRVFGRWSHATLRRPMGAQSPFRHQLGGSTQRQGDQEPGRAHGAHLIAGATVEEAAPRMTDLWQQGRAWSIDLLGEATISDREADRYRDRCVEALTLLAREAACGPPFPYSSATISDRYPRVQLSIKISALSPHLDPIDPEGSYRSVAARLRPVLNLAMRLPASLIFDMEQADTKALLVEIFTRLFAEPLTRTIRMRVSRCRPTIGKRSERYRGAPVLGSPAWVARATIRLVKGAYWDSDMIRYRQRGWAIPLFEQKVMTDANYEALTHLILSQTSLIRPAFGTHNLRTLAYIEAVAESLGLPPKAWEYQIVFGMAEPFQQAVTQYGRRLRLYTPVGDLVPGMAYLVRRLLENTSNESFLRKEYVESQPLSTLLAPPDLERLSQNQPSHRAGVQEFRNEPQQDFAQADSRAAMQQALATVRSQLVRQWTSTSGGQRLTGPLIESRNPGRPDQSWAGCPARVRRTSNRRCAGQFRHGNPGATHIGATSGHHVCRRRAHADAAR